MRVSSFDRIQPGGRLALTATPVVLILRASLLVVSLSATFLASKTAALGWVLVGGTLNGTPLLFLH